MPTFICVFCNIEKDWASEMVIGGAMPDDCDGVVAGMPYRNLGYCITCVNEGEF